MNTRSLVAAGLIVLAVVACDAAPTQPVGASAPLDADVTAAIQDIGHQFVDDEGLVGLAIGVVRDGRIVFSEGFGHADALRSRTVDDDTIFDIASVGKQFTAAAILKLVERGLVTLDQRVRTVVPELPDHFPDATIDQLLRHTSGFVGASLNEADPPDDHTRPRYGIDLLTDIELQGGDTRFAEQETWVYCNPGYLVLGLVVERASGIRYDDFVRDELLVPNGLVDMTVCERAAAPRMSDGLRRTVDGVAPVPFIDMTAYSGQGSICSSVTDLLRWSRALEEGRVITLESLAQMRTPSTVIGTTSQRTIPYGMAQRIGAIGAYRKVGHTGTYDGGSAALASYPAAKLEIAVISNTRGAGTPHAHEIETRIAKLLLGHDDPDVASLRRPVSAEQQLAIEGTYVGEDTFEALIEDDDLVVLRDGKRIERLVHIGDMHFRDPASPDVFEWFPMDGDRAGWWVYSMSGNIIEVLRRASR